MCLPNLVILVVFQFFLYCFPPHNCAIEINHLFYFNSFRNKAIYSLCTSPVHMKRLLYKIPINSISQCVPMPKNPISLSHSFPLGYVSIYSHFFAQICINGDRLPFRILLYQCHVQSVPMPMSLVIEVEK